MGPTKASRNVGNKCLCSISWRDSNFRILGEEVRVWTWEILGRRFLSQAISSNHNNTCVAME